MTKHTKGDEILLDGKLCLLEDDLHKLHKHVEEGRDRLAPEVKPLRPFPLNVVDSRIEYKVRWVSLLGLRIEKLLSKMRSAKYKSCLSECQ